jgi:hypothetical protein
MVVPVLWEHVTEVRFLAFPKFFFFLFSFAFRNSSDASHAHTSSPGETRKVKQAKSVFFLRGVKIGLIVKFVAVSFTQRQNFLRWPPYVQESKPVAHVDGVKTLVEEGPPNAPPWPRPLPWSGAEDEDEDEDEDQPS